MHSWLKSHVSRAVLLRWCTTLFGPGLIALIGVIYLIDHYRLVINTSPSLPNLAFWVVLGEQPTRRGDFILFSAIGNRYYQQPFVKQVVGLPGDSVTHQHRDVFVRGHFIGTAKPVANTGEPLAIGPSGTIPPHHYFVTTQHRDSYDSRYADIGFVPAVLILGVAHPIL
jgi:conjugal transfer pilin signal peptidase TrbI